LIVTDAELRNAAFREVRRVEDIVTIAREALPLYLLTVFGKGEKANLSKAERNELATLVAMLKTAAERRA
jgi:hypothetical protein